MKEYICGNCGYHGHVPTGGRRLAGFGIAAFGVFGWFSFLFAGSGHAFLISCVIFFVGLILLFSPEDEDEEKKFLKTVCPKCGHCNWKDEDQYIFDNNKKYQEKIVNNEIPKKIEMSINNKENNNIFSHEDEESKEKHNSLNNNEDIEYIQKKYDELIVINNKMKLNYEKLREDNMCLNNIISRLKHDIEISKNNKIDYKYELSKMQEMIDKYKSEQDDMIRERVYMQKEKKKYLALQEDMKKYKDINQNFLIRASIYGHIEYIQFLLDNGLDINYQDSNGNTALMNAIHAENNDSVVYLLAHGATLSFHNNKGETALNIAMKTNNKKIIKAVLDNDPHKYYC